MANEFDLINPERCFYDAIKNATESGGASSFLKRAVVTEIDMVGGQLDDSPKNPKNSIRARIISDSSQCFLSEDELPVFWPLFPFDVFPIKEGEHVYVVYENEAKADHGLWITRMAEPMDTDKKNYVAGIEKFKLNGSDITEQLVQDTGTAPKAVTINSNFIQEEVPLFAPRVGDRVIEGSNNTTIVLGRDRPDAVGSGEKEKAGTIDLVAGRAKAEDLNMKDDKSRIYVSMKTDADKNFSIDVGPAGGAAATIVINSEQIRVVAKGKGGSKKPMIKVVSDGEIIVEGTNIVLGKDADDWVVTGNKLVQFLTKVVVNTPAGPGALAMVPDGSPPGPSPNGIAPVPGPFYSFFSKKVTVKT